MDRCYSILSRRRMLLWVERFSLLFFILFSKSGWKLVTAKEQSCWFMHFVYYHLTMKKKQFSDITYRDIFIVWIIWVLLIGVWVAVIFFLTLFVWKCLCNKLLSYSNQYIGRNLICFWILMFWIFDPFLEKKDFDQKDNYLSILSTF